MSHCGFGGTPAIEVDTSPQYFGFYLVNPGEKIITASLAINVDDVSLLYVATDEGIEVVSKATASLTPWTHVLYYTQYKVGTRYNTKSFITPSLHLCIAKKESSEVVNLNMFHGR